MAFLRIGVLASGRGSNLQAIMDAIGAGELHAEVVVVISDKDGAGALERAQKGGIPALHISPGDFPSREAYDEALVKALESYGANFVALAGYMRLVTPVLLKAFPMRVVNIHPALLPAFPGLHGQKQALEYGVRYSGCTVHFVDEGLDTGPIILQAVVPVEPGDTEDTLSQRILQEEHRIYPQALELIAAGRVRAEGRKILILPEEFEELTPGKGPGPINFKE